MTTRSRVLGFCAVAVLAGAVVWMRRLRRKKALQTASVDGLFLYPLKSAQAISVSELHVDELGVKFDREWAAVKYETNKWWVISQRQSKKLCRIRPVLTASHLRLTCDGLPDLLVPLQHATGTSERVELTLQQCTCGGLLYGEEENEWLCRALEVPTGTYSLARLDRSQPRRVQKTYAGLVNDSDRVKLHFVSHFLFTSAPSLADMNARLKANNAADDEVPMDRFRANVVVSGVDAWAEDKWRELRLGPIEMKYMKYCVRCAHTTNDQTTGVPSGAEPLQTLQKCRRSADPQDSNGPLFGTYFMLTRAQRGVIRTTDVVEVVELREPSFKAVQDA